MKDTKFMTATEKEKVLRDWEAFLKNGCKRVMFTKALYTHLIMHCSFIAHYNIHGFYSTYFESGDDTAHFLEQFDSSKAQLGYGGKYVPRCIELGMTGWATQEEYADINQAMIEVAGKYIPGLVNIANMEQRATDIEHARLLLAKHGIKINV